MTQTDLQNAVAAIYPNIVYPGSYTIVLDTSGNASIGLWNNSVGPQPTVAQLTAALAQIPLTQAQTAQNAALLTSYNMARYGTTATITPAAGGAALTFPTDPSTQQNIIGYLVAFNATDAPAQMPLADANNAAQMLTYADIQALAKLIATQSIAVWQTLKSLQAQVATATTIAAVQAVVWPSH